jgi:hypothetical protein
MKPSRACYATQTEPTETWEADSDLGMVTLEGWGEVVRWDYDGGGASEPYFEDGVKAFLGTGKDRIEITNAIQRWLEEEERNHFA